VFSQVGLIIQFRHYFWIDSLCCPDDPHPVLFEAVTFASPALDRQKQSPCAVKRRIRIAVHCAILMEFIQRAAGNRQTLYTGRCNTQCLR
jgi:hypothetical protein